MTLAIVTTYYNEVETIGIVVAAIAKTTPPFRFYLIDDCSDAPPSDVLIQYGDKPWFTYLRNEENKGAVYGLNRGIRAALDDGAAFIAINDSDDISYDNRFAETLAAFKADPELMVIGGGADFTDQETDTHLWTTHHPVDNHDIRRKNWFNSTFVHSTITYRAAVFEKVGFYREGFYANDYDFISRILAADLKAANLPSVVLRYNVRQNSMSVSKRRRQVASRLGIQMRHFTPTNVRSWLGIVRTMLAYIAPNGAASRVKTTLHKLKNRPS